MAKTWVIQKRKPIEPLVPDYERDLHDPFLMKGMEKAVKRLLKAIEKKEKIMIFADYDADGVPGAAALATFFKKIDYQNFLVYLPDRHIEDYGLSLPAIDQAKSEGVSLLVTIDCGIANAKEIAYAKKLGIETIVTDHHLVPEKMPKAVAVVNPKREDCQYPYKHLCGAGVVFKLVQGLTSRFDLKDAPRSNLDVFLKWLLDLVAIATVSDMVPLTGENRALVHYGLKVLRRSPRPGIVELCRVLRVKQEYLTEDDIAFLIGPRINAASRMAHAREAYELLTTEDVVVAATIARRLESLNKDRRKCVDEILSVAGGFSQVLGNNLSGQQELSSGPRKQSPDHSESSCWPPIVVIGHESWSLGVLGLTAARLVEKYNRPVFIWGKNGNGLIKGSCRSDGSINVVELMRGVGEDFFTNLGGHHHAGGFSLHQDKLPELESRLLSAFTALDKDIVAEKIEIEDELTLEQVTIPFYHKLSELSPFGIENPKPVFLFSQIEIVEARKFGNGQAHLELIVTDGSDKKFKAISFFNTFSQHNLAAGQILDLAASVELSYFSYSPALRLRIVDLRRSG